MIIALRRLSTGAAILSFASLAAVATAQTPVTALDKQLDRIDFGVSASGILTKSTSGPNDLNQTQVTDSPGNTVGALISLRYTKSPLVGFEFNINYSRYTQNFAGTQINPTTTGTTVTVPYTLGIQAGQVEYSGGWVFHTPKVFGIGTFASAGAGATDFVPTRGGGLGYQSQARATYYFNVGLEQTVLNSHFGLRASYRQAFFLAPDFQQNFLRDHQRTSDIEPTIGFYLHF